MRRTTYSSLPDSNAQTRPLADRSHDSTDVVQHRSASFNINTADDSSAAASGVCSCGHAARPGRVQYGSGRTADARASSGAGARHGALASRPASGWRPRQHRRLDVAHADRLDGSIPIGHSGRARDRASRFGRGVSTIECAAHGGQRGNCAHRAGDAGRSVFAGSAERGGQSRTPVVEHGECHNRRRTRARRNRRASYRCARPHCAAIQHSGNHASDGIFW